MSEKDPEVCVQPLRTKIGRREGTYDEVGASQDKDNVANSSPEESHTNRIAGRATAFEEAPETEAVPPDRSKENEIHAKKSARAEDVSKVPAQLPPYRDNTYSLPDLILRKEQSRDDFIVVMKAWKRRHSHWIPG
ncbi:hypothetical protein H257_18503 [Aphanomyces astaci]|uniref:Uncharacterized protein n=1 Tax=Aphanomyces astaci TaxID=112090 RepID=W4FB13_APHAT|nr:hypothetical protein H257_18503 [Aphanomyces astaci]ETV64647.1 hypothetical protein H257_18503 [Aphanomyces astaci]|eukprot:XP_009845880.1 hypothetical protein H257_18503 [Aphanomyces astaci]